MSTPFNRPFASLLLIVTILGSAALSEVVAGVSSNEYSANSYSNNLSRLLQGSFDSKYIVLSSSMPLSELKILVERLGGRVLREFRVFNGVVFEGSPRVAQALIQYGLRVYKNRLLQLIKPIEEEFNTTTPMLIYGNPTIGANRLISIGYNGSGVRIAVIDTGIENLHPWLTRNNKSVVVWEVDATETGIVDYCGKRIGYYKGGLHGTHIAGIIASQYYKAPGVAPGASLYDIIIFPEHWGCWYTEDEYVIAGVEQALLGPDGKPDTGDEADVLSLSLGYIAPPEIQYAIKTGIVEDPVVKALEKAVEKGKVVVVAAGNGYGLNSVNALCLARGVICVGASNHMGTADPSDDVLAEFSSRGPGPLGELLPHVVAPGDGIYSSIPVDLAAQYNLTEPGAYLSGTSMATPFVSGSIALLVQYFRAHGLNPNSTILIARLIQTAIDVKLQGLIVSATSGGERGASLLPSTPVDQGGGLINVYNATFAELEIYVEGRPIGSFIVSNQPFSFNITVKNTLSKTITVSTLKSLAKFWDIYTFRNVSEYINIEETAVYVKPGSIISVKVTISGLDPGVYAGYVSFTVKESNRTYRLPVLLIIPLNITLADLRTLYTLNSTIGTRDYSDVVTLFISVNEPIYEPLFITPLSTPGATSGMITLTLITPSGVFTSFANTVGYVLLETGIYTISVYLWSVYVLYPSNISFTLIIGLPTLTQRVKYALSQISLIEINLTMINSALESLRGEIQANTSRVEQALRELEKQLSGVRGSLEQLRVDLLTINSTLTSSLLIEAAKLEDQISQLEARLRELRLELSATSQNMSSKIESLSTNISSLEEQSQATRNISLIALPLGLIALLVGVYGIIKKKL